MSIAAMVSGTISKIPETRTTQKGALFAFTTVRSPAADGDTYINVTVFDSTLVDTLTHLNPGDPITVIGTGKIGTYEPKDGSGTRASLSITASRIIALVDHQAPPRQRQHRPDGSRQTTGSQYRQTDERQPYQPAGPREFAPDDFSDSIPF